MKMISMSQRTRGFMAMDGWLSFCKAYKIKEYRRHGEAGSVDMEKVAVEQVWVQNILTKFAPKDCWNLMK